MSFKLEAGDIYFITGLSNQSEIVNLHALGVGGGLTIEEYIAMYFLLDIKKIESQVSVNVIENLSLKVIVLVLAMIAGLESLHHASRPLMFYAVECMRPTVYDWSTQFLNAILQ